VDTADDGNRRIPTLPQDNRSMVLKVVLGKAKKSELLAVVAAVEEATNKAMPCSTMRWRQ
jgi:hypothetical protein